MGGSWITLVKKREPGREVGLSLSVPFLGPPARLSGCLGSLGEYLSLEMYGTQVWRDLSDPGHLLSSSQMAPSLTVAQGRQDAGTSVGSAHELGHP